MMRKKKTLVSILFVMVLLIIHTPAYASVKSYITDKKYAGTYYLSSGENENGKIGGHKDVTDKHGAYYVIIKKISKKGKIKFAIENISSNGRRLTYADVSGSIKGKKVSFHWTDNWGSIGKGSLIINKNRKLKLQVKTTSYGKKVRGTMDVSNGKL